MSKRILVVSDYDGLYGRFWGQLGEISCDITEFMIEPGLFDLICFTGGEDVSPELYGHKNLASHNNSARDRKEVVIFEMAHKHEIPMTGICRGSQLLNVMCGGTMVQDLRMGHGGGRHLMETRGRQAMQSMQVTSSHHQMSVLGEGGIFFGASREMIPTEACIYDGDLRELDEKHVVWDCNGHYDLCVTEAFAYPHERIFAVQHHPEWQDINEEAPQWTLRKIREICFRETDSAHTVA